MKTFFSAIISMLKKNFWMKIAAIGFAALLWLFVIADTNPPRVKQFRDIPVTFSNTQILKEKGLCFSEDYNDIISAADVSIEANTDALQYLDEDQISVYIDVSSVNSAGICTLKLQGKTASGNVMAVNPSKVEARVEDLVTRELPVEVQLTGKTSNAYYYGEPELSRDIIEISGPHSKVETYSKAVCYLDVTDIAEPTTESRNITILDKEGNAIQEDSYGEKLPSVIVRFPVYPQRSVAVDTKALAQSISGIAEGYEIKQIIIHPTEVLVAGDEHDIEDIPSVTLEPIALNNATADALQKAAVVLPQGAAAVSPLMVDITIQIGVIEEEKLYEAADISVKNLGDGLKYTISPKSIDIRVVGTKENLSNITASDIVPFVDLDGLGAGIHTASIKFENEPDLNAKLIPEYYTAEVHIEKK